MGKIGIAVMGTGKAGQSHLFWYHSHVNSKLIGVYNRDAAKSRAAAKQYGIKVYDDWRDIVDDSSVDAISITGPSSLRAEQAVAACRAGKHVLCEKPFANTVAECDQMIDAANKHGVVLMVCLTMRFHPVCYAIESVIDQIRPIYHISMDYPNWRNGITWRHSLAQGGGVLKEQGCHLFDLGTHFLGDIKQIYGENLIVNPGREVDDHSLALIRFASGAIGRIYASYCHPHCNKIAEEAVFGQIIGCRGRLDFSLSPYAPEMNKVFLTNDVRTEVPVVYPSVVDPIYPGMLNSFGEVINEFFDCIQNNRKPRVAGEEGRSSLVAVLAAYESQRLNKPIDFASFKDGPSAEYLPECFQRFKV